MFYHFIKIKKFLKPYIILVRLHSWAGTWLLLLPCLWGMSLANPHINWKTLALFVGGAFFMRSAGCIINDIIDANIDCKIARTCNRPLAARTLSLKHAIFLLLVFLGGGLWVLIHFSEQVIFFGFLLLPCIFIYPFLKRFSSFPQVFLGLIFNSGLIVGWLSRKPSLTGEIWGYYFGAIFWTIGYDTLYALPDLEDDRRAHIKSTALWMGRYVSHGILTCYFLFYGIWFCIAFFCERYYLCGSVFFLFLLTMGKMWSQNLLQDSSQGTTFFKKNIWIGAGVWCGILLDNLVLLFHEK